MKSNFIALYKNKFKTTRNIHLAHNDLVVHTGEGHFDSLKTPSFLDYPEFNDDDVEKILEYCSNILHNIFYFYSEKNLDFKKVPIEIGKDLFDWLNYAIKKREEDNKPNP